MDTDNVLKHLLCKESTVCLFDGLAMLLDVKLVASALEFKVVVVTKINLN